MRNLIREARIGVDWWLKGRIPWSAPVRLAPVADVERWLQSQSEVQRHRLDALGSTYDLGPLLESCPESELARNLHHLDLLDQHLGGLAPPLRALDVGCRSWWNLPANHVFRPCPWTGVELDAHQRFVDGSTRGAVARARAQLFSGATFVSGSAADLQGSYELIVWLLPYVTRGAFAADRLPTRYFKPRELLGHVLGLLAPEGALLVVNQGPEEAQIQERLLRDAGAPFHGLGPLESLWEVFEDPRWGFLVRKETQG